MIITVQFAFTCRICGRRGAAGSQAEWSKAGGTAHTSCAAKSAPAPKAKSARKPAAPRPAPRVPQAGEIEISRKGDRHGRYTVGETIYAAKVNGGGGDGHYWTVVAEGFSRANEDMGHYDDFCWATVRPATDAEVAPVAARRAAADAAKSAAAVAAGGMVALARVGQAVTEGTCLSLVAVEAHRVVMAGASKISTVKDRSTTTTWFRTVDGTLVRESHGYDDHRQCAYITAEALLASVAAQVDADADDLPLADSLRNVASRYSYPVHRARVWLAASRGETVPVEVVPPTLEPRELETDADVLAMSAQMGASL
jgi:hypothetical protein